MLQFYDDNCILSGGRDGYVRMYDLGSGKLVNKLSVGNPITSLQYDKNRLVFAAEKMPPVLFDWTKQQTIREFLGHAGNVHHLHFEEQTLVTASSDSTVKLWHF